MVVVGVASAEDLRGEEGEEEEEEEGGEGGEGGEEESEGLRLAYSVEEVVSRKTYNKLKKFRQKLFSVMNNFCWS